MGEFPDGETTALEVIMAKRSILLSELEILPTLNGRKTQLRRVVKPQPYLSGIGGIVWKEISHGMKTDGKPYLGEFVKHCPYGQPGDYLWVRETWANILFTETDCGMECDGIVDLGAPLVKPPLNSNFYKYGVVYRADGYEAVKEVGERWIPSTQMPEWASRITLEITGVRVERLQDITTTDIAAEGVCPDGRYLGEANRYRHAFEDVWYAINAKCGYSWESNPFVWVIEYKVVTTKRKTIW